MTALEAGGSAVVRGNWRDHISVPLQTGRGWTRVGPGGRGDPRVHLLQRPPCPQI